MNRNVHNIKNVILISYYNIQISVFSLLVSSKERTWNTLDYKQLCIHLNSMIKVIKFVLHSDSDVGIIL